MAGSLSRQQWQRAAAHCTNDNQRASKGAPPLGLGSPMHAAPTMRTRAVAVGEEQSPSTRQAVDAEVQGMLKSAYQRVTR